MNAITLEQFDLLDVGNSVTMCGAMYAGNGHLYLVPFPDSSLQDMENPIQFLVMPSEDWERFLHQSDVQDVRTPNKAILRKSQRMIDRTIQWDVFRRDHFRCRYCGQERPLTVDHVILWESGGASVSGNLISSCARCNRLRGNMEYDVWLNSEEYRKVSAQLDGWTIENNLMVARNLERLRSIVTKQRSR